MTKEEIKKGLAEIARNPEHKDQVRALEILAKIEGRIRHGNQEKKDWREVVVVRREREPNKRDQEKRAM